MSLTADYKHWLNGEQYMRMFARMRLLENNEVAATFKFNESLDVSRSYSHTHTIATGNSPTISEGVQYDYIVITSDETITATIYAIAITFVGTLAVHVTTDAANDDIVVSNTSGNTATVEVFLAKEA